MSSPSTDSGPGGEPLAPAQTAPVQQLQFVLSESSWDADVMTARALQVLGEDSLTGSDPNGMLVIDDPADPQLTPAAC